MQSRSLRSTILLSVGAAAGIVLAAAGLMTSSSLRGGLPNHALARVNGELIRAEEYQAILGAVAADRRNEIDAAERRRLLDRLIDEELLVQRALELGLARRDRKIRSDLTAAVVESVVTEAQDAQPTEAELETFYAQHRERFAPPASVRVRQIFFRASAADDEIKRERAREAARRVRSGEPFETVREAMGEPELPVLPDDLLPPAKLREYLGPTAARAALTLAADSISDPVRSGTGYHVLQVVERHNAPPPPLARVRSQVEAEFRRQRAENALRRYLDGLRAQAAVEIAPELP